MKKLEYYTRMLMLIHSDLTTHVEESIKDKKLKDQVLAKSDEYLELSVPLLRNILSLAATGVDKTK